MDNDDSRRQYWISQMEQGHAFMEDLMKYPVSENSEPVFPLIDVAGDSGVEVVFSQSQIAPGLDRQFFLRRGLVDNFVAAAREMNEIGWVLKVEDAYRSEPMQRQLGVRQEIVNKVIQMIVWENNGQIPELPLIKRRLGVLVARFPKTGTHMSSSALDISVLNRNDGTEIDRGRPYLEMSEKTPMQSPFVDQTALQNRARITEIMGKHNFAAYPFEFWHYSSGDAIYELLMNSGKPACYGAVHLDRGSNTVEPIDDPLAPLNDDDTVLAKIKVAIASEPLP